jgi:hypothetical protein
LPPAAQPGKQALLIAFSAPFAGNIRGIYDCGLLKSGNKGGSQNRHRNLVLAAGQPGKMKNAILGSKPGGKATGTWLRNSKTEAKEPVKMGNTASQWP